MELGITADELGAMPPGDVFDLLEAWRQREKRADFRAAQVCTILAEVNRDKDRKPTPFHPGDFFPSFAEDREPISESELEAKLEALANFGR